MPSRGSRKSQTCKEGSSLPSFLLRAVAFERSRLKLIDQTELPTRIHHVYPRSAAETAKAIERLAVRGAPSIGVAAAYGIVVESLRLPDNRLRQGLRKAALTLVQARPTAVNLGWAVERMKRILASAPPDPGALRKALLAEARRIEAEEITNSRMLAEHGAKLLPQGAKVLTICNTGALAAPGLGTALGVIFRAHLKGKRPQVFACETRPLLQGARLTALELARAHIPCTLIVDSAAATVMPECDLAIVGADRIARNGDFANKVGTRMLAIIARRYHKPFYVAAPSSTFDLDCATGKDIIVEQRSAEEVTEITGRRTAPKGTKVFNPAFDVTQADLVKAFITEKGIIRPPFRKNISRKIH